MCSTHLVIPYVFCEILGTEMSVDFCSSSSQEYFPFLHIQIFLTIRRKSTQHHQVLIIQNFCHDITNSFIILEFQLAYAALTLIPVVHFLYEVIYRIFSKNFRYANWIYLVQEIIEDSEQNALSTPFTLWYFIHRKYRITDLPRKAINTLLDVFKAIFRRYIATYTVCDFSTQHFSFLSILILQSLGPRIGIQISFPGAAIVISLSSAKIVLIYTI